LKNDCKHKPSCFEKPGKQEKQEKAASPVSQADLRKLRELAQQLAAKSPDKAAIILTGWLNQPARSKGKKAA
jgi:hypothetical protein